MRYASEVLADAPVGYWPLDDWDRTGGVLPIQAMDYSGNNLHSLDWAVIGRTPGPIAGRSAGLFYGPNSPLGLSGMTIPGSALLDLQTFTIEAWIRPEIAANVGANVNNPNPAAQNGFIFEKTTNGQVNTQYSLFIEGVVMAGREAANTLYTGNFDLSPVPRWRHVAYQHRGPDGYSLHSRDGLGWWDGTRTGTVPSGGGAAGTSFIGVYGGGGYRFAGAIAHVAVYGTFLSQARLQAHVQAAAADSATY